MYVIGDIWTTHASGDDASDYYYYNESYYYYYYYYNESYSYYYYEDETDQDQGDHNCAHYRWKNDGFCDDLNNKAGCDWDGGDCCAASRNDKEQPPVLHYVTWSYFCKEVGVRACVFLREKCRRRAFFVCSVSASTQTLNRACQLWVLRVMQMVSLTADITLHGFDDGPLPAITCPMLHDR